MSNSCEIARDSASNELEFIKESVRDHRKALDEKNWDEADRIREQCLEGALEIGVRSAWHSQVLPIDKARELLALLESRPVTSARMNEWEAACRKKGWTFSEDSPEDWRKHFEEKHVDICNMLRASIMSGEPLYWSI